MVANNTTILDKIAHKVRLNEKCPDGFFVGYTDAIEEGKWVDVVENAPMTLNNWGYDQPDNFGEAGEDCAYYNINEKKIHDTPCYAQFCPVCQLKTDVLYQFDRMCEDSHVDTLYSMKSPREFIGLKSTKMIKAMDRWEIVSTSDNEVQAYTNTYDIPFGDNDWFFTDNVCFDGGIDWTAGDYKTRKLNFHLAVKRPGMFCCSDGQCMDSNIVCNGIYECDSGSDESFCDDRIIENYSSMKDKINTKDIELTVNVTLLDVFDISQSDSTFSLHFWLKLEWINPNYDFLFLNSDFHLNEVAKMTKNSIYLPEIQFARIFDGQFLKLKESVVIEKTANPAMSSQTDHVRPKEMYKGIENRFLMEALIDAQFSCSFDSVKTYPYGDQICSFRFFLTGAGKLNPGYVSYQGKPEVGQYQIGSNAWSIECNGNVMRNMNHCRNCQTVKVCTVSVFLNRNLQR